MLSRLFKQFAGGFLLFGLLFGVWAGITAGFILGVAAFSIPAMASAVLVAYASLNSRMERRTLLHRS